MKKSVSIETLIGMMNVSNECIGYDHMVNDFTTFCNSQLAKEVQCTNQFGAWEYASYLQYLADVRPYKAAYAYAIFVRRVFRIFSEEGIEFKTSPAHWKAPPKPDKDHFEPLSFDQCSKLSSYLKSEIDKIYQRENLIKLAIANGKPITRNGDSFTVRGDSFYKWQEILPDVLHTLLVSYPDFPVNASESDIEVNGRFGLIKAVDYPGMTNSFKTIRKRMGLQRLRLGVPFLSDRPDLKFWDVIEILYPGSHELSIVRIAIALETGWSPDVVARIDPEEYLHQAIDTGGDLAFLKTKKVKGEQRGRNYSESKLLLVPSSTTDLYGAYNLIRLWLKRTARIRNAAEYAAVCTEIGAEPLLLSLQDMQNFAAKGRWLGVCHPASGHFKNKSGVMSSIFKSVGFEFDERQLRPTSAYLRSRKQDIPLLLQVALFGHSDSSITDEFYKSGAVFQQHRMDKLAGELGAIEASLQDGSFAGQLVPLRTDKTVKQKIMTVFSDPINHNPLAVCSDPLSPDWPGAKSAVSKGRKCYTFTKCLICKRSRVFSDNIPFVVDRYLYLEQKRRTYRDDQFAIYKDEYDAARNIIESWPYKQDIDEAKDRTLIEGFILPPQLFEVGPWAS